MYNFCTYFDQYYLARGVVMYSSLRLHCPESRLWVLCMDEKTYTALKELKLPGVYPIPLEEFERNDEYLRAAKANRSKIEYYFTCTPSLPLYIFNHWPEIDIVTYIDADLLFFANPQPLFNELGANSVSIIEHRFPNSLKTLELYGIYNVGWLSFRRDVHGLACLQWWRDRCNEWCYDRLENDRYADQKYLNDWPTRFSNVVVLQNKGANLAPWNLANYELSNLNDETILVDGQPLIFFHFHGLKKIISWLYDPRWVEHNVSPSKVLRHRIYAPYIKKLFDVNRKTLSISNTPLSGHRKNGVIQSQERFHLIRAAIRNPKKLISVFRTLLTGRYIIIVGEHII